MHLTAAALAIAASFAAAGSPPLPQVVDGRIERLADFPSKHVPSRNIDVWLPEGYPDRGPYAVLYMHDGQMLFDAQTTWNQQEWQVDEVAGRLIASGAVRPFIVVGIWNDSRARHSEYFPQKAFESLPAAVQAAQLDLEREPGRKLFAEPPSSDRYLAFVVDELRPEIERRFRVATGSEHTFLMGSSMGGLISMYALSERSSIFGGAACLSTHWPGGFKTEDNPLAPALLAYVEAHFPRAGRHRVWFDHGTATLDAWYSELQLQVDTLLRNKGYAQSDWVSRVYEGAEHSEKAWSKRLDEPLRFLFAKEPLNESRAQRRDHRR